MTALNEMMVDQIKDAVSAEKQGLLAMKRMLRRAHDPQLRQGLEAHIAETEQHRGRMEQALEHLGVRTGRKVCEAMRGLVDEAQHETAEHDQGPVLDLVIANGQQRMEHYEISAYGTMLELSRALGQDEVAALLARTLAEEQSQGAALTAITRGTLLPAALRAEAD